MERSRGREEERRRGEVKEEGIGIREEKRKGKEKKLIRRKKTAKGEFMNR